MIRNGYYYPDYIWKNTCHSNEITGKAEGECAFGFAVGNRRAGKSVGIGIFAIADFLLFGYENVLIRRYLDDFKKKKAMENFWMKSWNYFQEFPNIVKSDVKLQEIYPLDLVENFNWDGHEMTFSENHAYIDGKCFSYPCALNKYNDFKNENFKNIHKLIYDEFITEDGSRLDKEVFALYNVLDTAARGRDNALNTTAVIFISNSITNVNDFYIELGIDKELRADTKRLYRPDKGYVLECVMNNAAADEMNTSKIAKVMQGSIGQQYLGYSQGNEVKDDESFVERLSGRMNYLYNLKYDDKLYAIKYHYEECCYYMTDEGVDETAHCYALQREDHTLDTVLLTTALRAKMGIVKSFYASGFMRFSSFRCKSIFLDFYRYL